MEKLLISAMKDLLKIWNKAHKKRETELDIINNTFNKDPKILVKEYILPNCQPTSPSDTIEEGPNTVFASSIMEYLDEFLSGKTTSRKDGTNQLFVLSDAGMGKTSLLVMLKVFDMFSYLPKDYTCTLMKLGEDTLETIEKISERRNTVLLLDSLDEDPLAWGRIEERIEELLHASTAFKRVIITCRTQFFPDTNTAHFENPSLINLKGYRCPIVYLSPFNDEQVDQFLKLKFPDKKFFWKRIPHQEFATGKQIITNMNSLRFRPMLLSYIDLLVEDEFYATNISLLYDKLINLWLSRDVVKKLWSDRTDLESMELALMVIASEMSKENIRFASQIYLKNLTVLNAEIGIIREIDITGRSLMNKTFNGELRFSHFSIQEFLTAKRIVLDPKFEIDFKKLTDQEISFILDLIQHYRFDKIKDNLPNLTFKARNTIISYKQGQTSFGEDGFSYYEYTKFNQSKYYHFLKNIIECSTNRTMDLLNQNHRESTYLKQELRAIQNSVDKDFYRLEEIKTHLNSLELEQSDLKKLDNRLSRL